MSYKVFVYHQSVPNAKNAEKVDLLKHFARGVKISGDEVRDIYDFVYSGNEDVSVIQGWISDNAPNKSHQLLRQSVVKSQVRSGKYVVAVDSNLFLYATPDNPLHYLRYSFNGVFPNTGIYCDQYIDQSRWTKISRDLNLSLKDYRTNGDHILICLQRNGGWSMGNIDVCEWAQSIIEGIRMYSDRPIVIRPHPGDKHARHYTKNLLIKYKNQKVTLSQPGSTLISDLQNCWAAVNNNSSPVVGAAIEGVPIFVTDPGRSQCQEIANVNLAEIETPKLFDRLPWVQRLSMFHWKFDELISGECWQHMRNYLVKFKQ